MRQTSAIASKLPSFIAALLALAFLVTVGVGKSCAEDPAVLSVIRQAAVGRSVIDMDVYINGKHLGKIKNGKSAKFAFKPKKDGNNVLFLKIPGLTDAKSANIIFYLKSGKISFCRSTYNANLLGDSLTVQFLSQAGRWIDPK